ELIKKMSLPRIISKTTMSIIPKSNSNMLFILSHQQKQLRNITSVAFKGTALYNYRSLSSPMIYSNHNNFISSDSFKFQPSSRSYSSRPSELELHGNIFFLFTFTSYFNFF